MIVWILEGHASTAGALEYNNKKVRSGEASVLYVENVPGGYPNVSKLFRKFESNPKINGHMKHMCLHLAVSPATYEEYDDAKIQAFVEEIAEKIGYSEQPHIVYKHNDIEREHYHFVAPKVNEHGKAIRFNFGGSNWDYYGLRRVVHEIGPKYGFTVVFEQKDRSTSEYYQKTGLFDAKKSDAVRKDLKAIIFQALKYNYKTPQEFKDILFHFGVKWNEKAFENHKMAFQGCDKSGKETSIVYPLEPNMGMKGYSRFVDRLGNNTREQREIDTMEASDDIINRAKIDIAYLMAVCRHCFRRARSSEEYRKYLAESGVSVRILRADGRYDSEHAPGEILGSVKSISFMVRKRYYVCSGETAQRFLSSKEIEQAEKDGRWSGRAEPLIKKKMLTKADAAAIETAIRTNMQKSGARLDKTPSLTK